MSDPAPAAAAEAGAPVHLRTVVLAGGLNVEREVSLSSGTQVAEELARAGVEAELDLHSTFDGVDTGTFRAVSGPGGGLTQPGIVGPANSDRYEDRG